MTMDFIVGLPLVDGYDSVCVSVDRLTKEQHLTACHSTITSEGLADLFIRDIFRLHGLPDSVTSDRGVMVPDLVDLGRQSRAALLA